MKKAIIMLSVLSALALILCSCNMEKANTNETASDTQTAESPTTETPTSNNTSIKIINTYPTADYECQLHISDCVILGEVTEELGGKYTNPDNLIKDYANSWVWQYAIRVDKSYKGNFNEGDIVTVIVASESGYSPEDEQALSVTAAICGGSGECELKKGQAGVFMLEKSKYFLTDSGNNGYTVVFGSEGAFFPVTEGDASMAENAETVYASNSLKLKLSELPVDIARAEAEYANDDGKSELLADDEDEEE